MARMHPGVASLAIVPLGMTDHRKNLPQLTPFTPEIARATIAHIEPVQRRFKKQLGTPFVYLGDEIYIMAGAKLPPAAHYRDFPQIENGVGMVRTFLKQFDAAHRAAKGKKMSAKGTVCTGRVFFPYLKESVDRLGSGLKVIP